MTVSTSRLMEEAATVGPTDWLKGGGDAAGVRVGVSEVVDGRERARRGVFEICPNSRCK